MIRRLAAFAVLIAACAAAPCLAQDRPAAAAAQLDPERLALANQVIDLSFPLDGRRAMLLRAVDTMTAQLRASAPQMTGGSLDAGMERILDRFLGRVRVATERLIDEYSPPIFAALARAYARNFTRDELVQIRDFVATPAGLKYVQQSIELLADPDMARANTAYMTSVLSTMQPLHAELRRELEDYARTPRARPERTPRNGTR